jgi:hypothetical protein
MGAAKTKPVARPRWWQRIVGEFEDDPVFYDVVEEVHKRRRAEYATVNALRARELALQQQVGNTPAVTADGTGPGWKRNLGLFAGDEAFAEVVRLGAKIRRADRIRPPKRKRLAKPRKTPKAKTVSSAKRTA